MRVELGQREGDDDAAGERVTSVLSLTLADDDVLARGGDDVAQGEPERAALPEES